VHDAVAGADWEPGSIGEFAQCKRSGLASKRLENAQCSVRRLHGSFRIFEKCFAKLN